ncbi:MAG: PaaI family thioesterase [Alphaproteobacteria bacterium]|nr:PaaI family thioesterase [Alphaproteobacteria bacterium]MBF0371848.1 PaaI family thioesterase [Alphaproteobacteria bacterium]MBF0394371.1 PaaI family thioesterase [Alphaproteobacteria bacterium]
MSEFEPKNPDYAQAVRDGFGRQPFMAHLGARLTAIEPGRVEIRLPYRDEVGQNHGFFHGGAIGAIADVSGGFAGFSLMGKGGSVLTVEYKINIVAPGLGEELIGRGEVIRMGGTLIITEARLYVLRDGAESLCAIALQTLRGKQTGREVAF